METVLLTDLPTLLLMIVVMSGGMAFAVLFVSHRPRKAHDSLPWWGGGLLLNTLAFIAFASLRSTNLAGMLVVGNVLMSASVAAALRSLTLYCQVTVPRSWFWSPLICVALISVGLIGQPLWRVPLVDLIIAVQTVLAACVALRPVTVAADVPVERGRILLIGGMLLIAAVYLMRISVVVLGNADVTRLFSPDWSQTLSYMLGLIGILFSTLGFVLMHQERSEQLYRRQALQDALTGVANRRAIMASLSQVLAFSARCGGPVAVMMIDIDHFKRVNDRHGHLVGDMVLSEVAGRMKRRLRNQDLLGRYGGEEFLAVFPGTDRNGALRIAEDLRRQFADRAIHVPGLEIGITLSIGVHCCLSGPGSSAVDAMIEAADQALYAAKTAGRDRVEFAAPD